MRATLFLLALCLLASSALASEWLNTNEDVKSLSNLIDSLENTLPADNLSEIEEEDDLALGASSSVSGAPAGPGAPTPLPVQTGPTVWFVPAFASIKETDVTGYTVTVKQSVATPGSATVVPITCSATFHITTRFAACPQSVTILAGETTASFKIYPVDNNIIDGTALVTVAAVTQFMTPASVQWLNTEMSWTSFEITDDDATKPAPLPPKLARCDPRLPTVITISGAGDKLANQDYTIGGARGVYYCTYTGVTRNTWALGIRSASMTGRRMLQLDVGQAERWQLWWNARGVVGGGEIRYESLNLDTMLGFLGPYQPYKGFRPTPKVMAKTLSKAITESCVQLTGASATDAKFNQFYMWEDTLTWGLTRYRGVTDKTLVIVYSQPNLFNQNTGYWYVTEQTSFTAWYRSEEREQAVTAKYVTQGKATGTNVPTVAIVPSSNCPAAITGTCVRATGSTNPLVNQIYKKNEAAQGRLTIYIGTAYTAWSISSYSKGTESWSGYWFIGSNGNQIYYANKRDLPVTSSYYAVTSNATNQGVVVVTSTACTM